METNFINPIALTASLINLVNNVNSIISCQAHKFHNPTDGTLHYTLAILLGKPKDPDNGYSDQEFADWETLTESIKDTLETQLGKPKYNAPTDFPGTTQVYQIPDQGINAIITDTDNTIIITITSYSI